MILGKDGVSATAYFKVYERIKIGQFRFIGGDPVLLIVERGVDATIPLGAFRLGDPRRRHEREARGCWIGSRRNTWSSRALEIKVFVSLDHAKPSRAATQPTSDGGQTRASRATLPSETAGADAGVVYITLQRKAATLRAASA